MSGGGCLNPGWQRGNRVLFCSDEGEVARVGPGGGAGFTRAAGTGEPGGDRRLRDRCAGRVLAGPGRLAWRMRRFVVTSGIWSRCGSGSVNRCGHGGRRRRQLLRQGGAGCGEGDSAGADAGADHVLPILGVAAHVDAAVASAATPPARLVFALSRGARRSGRRHPRRSSRRHRPGQLSTHHRRPRPAAG